MAIGSRYIIGIPTKSNSNEKEGNGRQNIKTRKREPKVTTEEFATFYEVSSITGSRVWLAFKEHSGRGRRSKTTMKLLFKCNYGGAELVNFLLRKKGRVSL